MQGQYNLRSPAVKRLMKEAQELKDPTELYHAQPLEDNLFEWHFTLRGPEESDFDGGVYHGRIILPPEYPMKPPSIILLTPNGRFETFKKICLSISGHHPESWQPSWSIRTALLAIIGFMPTHGGGAIGSLDYTPEERKVLAKKSQDWKCPECGDVSQQLKPKTEASEKASQEAKELASQINFQGEKPGATPTKTSEGNACTTSITTSATSGQPNTVFASTPSPAQPSFPYPWAMPQGWGALPQQNPGVPRPLAFARFPYPPPMMLPPPGMFMPPPPNSYGQRLPGFPPMPFFQPGMRGLPQAQGASGVVTEGTSPQMAGAAAVSSSPANQQQGSAPSNPTSSSVTPVSSPTVATQPTTAASTAAPSSSAAHPAPASAETVGAASHTQAATTSSDSTATPAQSTSTSASPSTDTTALASTTSPSTDTTALASTTSPSTDTTALASTTSPSTDTPALASTTSPSTDTTALASTTTTAPSTELRQRTGATTTTAQPHTPSGTPAASDAPAAQSQGSYSRGTIVMMVILSMAITLLLGRRMYMLYFGRGFQGYFD